MAKSKGHSESYVSGKPVEVHVNGKWIPATYLRAVPTESGGNHHEVSFSDRATTLDGRRIRPAQPLEIADLNPGIRETVYWLRGEGFDTCDSGDGKTHMMECDPEYAYVAIRVAPEKMFAESHRLYNLMKARVDPERFAEGPKEFDGTIPDLPPAVQATYDPADKLALIQLLYADDEILGLTKPR